MTLENVLVSEKKSLTVRIPEERFTLPALAKIGFPPQLASLATDRLCRTAGTDRLICFYMK